MSDLINKTIKSTKYCYSFFATMIYFECIMGVVTLFLKLYSGLILCIINIVVFILTNICLKKLQNALKFRHREEVENIQGKLLFLLIGEVVLFWPLFVMSIPLFSVRKKCSNILQQWSTFCQVESTADDNSTAVGEE